MPVSKKAQIFHQKITKNPYDKDEDLGYEVVIRLWGKGRETDAEFISKKISEDMSID